MSSKNNKNNNNKINENNTYNKANSKEDKRLSIKDKKVTLQELINVFDSKENKITSVTPDKKKVEKNVRKKKSIKKDDLDFSGFDIIDEIEVNEIKNDMKEDKLKKKTTFSKTEPNFINVDLFNLWDVIVVPKFIHKTSRTDFMKNIMSNIVYNGITFKEKLSQSLSTRSIIIYDHFENNYSNKLLKKIKNSFLYMSYRSGLINTSFLPGNKNDYTSDCGWGCMVRCCQMMLSRGLIKQKIDSLIKDNHPEKKLKNGTEPNLNVNDIRKGILMLFYDKFIGPQDVALSEGIYEIYKKLLKDKTDVGEIIPPYSIYILTLIGKCPNIFTSDTRMISCFLKINNTLFNNQIQMIHFKNGNIQKKELFQTFCQKIDENNKNDQRIDKEEYNFEKYKFNRGGLIFISLRLGLHTIEPCYINIIPKFFSILHNNIGFVSGKKKRAFYFIGMYGDKLIFADPHLNQKIDDDIQNFPTYSVNDLFLISIKELSSEITIGISISSINDLKQFTLDIKQLQGLCNGLIYYDE